MIIESTEVPASPDSEFFQDPDLTITAVRVWMMVGPVDPPWQISTVLYDEMRATFVEVELANGAVGWGECLVREAPSATKAVIEEVLAPLLIGQNAGRVQGLWDTMYWMFRTRGHSRGIVPEAIAGVDTAIWDALGHSAGKSISQLLYGVGRTSIHCYASSIMVVDEETTARETEELLEAGYDAIKVKVGQDVRLDARRINLVRRIAGDDLEIMIDVNANFGLTKSIEFIKLIQDADVSWVEEPIVADDLPGYRKLSRTFPTVPLAAGEAEFTTAGFREFCEERILTVFQPDVARAGGITGMIRIAQLAHAYNIPLAPHVGASAGICAAASIQVSAAISNFRIYEHMFKPHALQDVFVGPPPAPVAGRIAVPTGPGLGLRLDTAKLAKLKV